MELRYVGFSQLQNARAYRFDLAEAGHATRQLIVTADLGLFRVHQVGIQEGPNLCAKKLAADLEGCSEGTHTADGSHELTSEDLRAFSSARDAEKARKVASRKGGARPSKARSAVFQSPWRRSPSCLLGGSPYEKMNRWAQTQSRIIAEYHATSSTAAPTILAVRVQ